MDDEDERERSEKGGTARAQSPNAFKKRDFGARPGKGHVWPPEGYGHRGCACGYRAQRGHVGEDVKVQTSPDNTGPVPILYLIIDLISSASAMSSTELPDWHKM